MLDDVTANRQHEHRILIQPGCISRYSLFRMSYFGVSFDSLLQNAELFTEQLVTAAEQATATATLATSADVTAAVSGTAGSGAPTAAEPEPPGSEDTTAVVERLRSALQKSREKAARLKHDRDEAVSFLTDVGVLAGPGASQPAMGSLSAATLLERWRDVVATVAAVGWAPQITLEQVCQAAAASATEVATLRKENASLESRCRSLQTRLSEPRVDATVEESLAALRARAARAEEDARDSRAATERLLAECDAWRASASENGARNGDEPGKVSAAVDALIVRAEAAERTAAQMRDRLEVVRLESEAALQALRARTEAEVAASEARVESMAAQLGRAEAEMAALSARARPRENEEPGGAGAELQAARELAAAAEAALKECQTAAGARIAELEAAMSAEAVHAKDAALSLQALPAELDAARSELAALRDDGAAEASRLRDELAASEAESGRLRLGVDKEKAARTRAVEKARRVLREQADSHAAELASLRAEADQAAARQKGLEDELHGAAAQLSSLTAARDALARQVSSSRREWGKCALHSAGKTRAALRPRRWRRWNRSSKRRGRQRGRRRGACYSSSQRRGAMSMPRCARAENARPSFERCGRGRRRTLPASSRSGTAWAAWSRPWRSRSRRSEAAALRPRPLSCKAKALRGRGRRTRTLRRGSSSSSN